MIRVIYHFKVKAGEEKNFEEAWQKVTETIRGKCSGTHGSSLLRSAEDSSKYYGVARWESDDAWHLMRQGDVPQLDETEKLMQSAERISVEAFEEAAYLEF